MKRLLLFAAGLFGISTLRAQEIPAKKETSKNKPVNPGLTKGIILQNDTGAAGKNLKTSPNAIKIDKTSPIQDTGRTSIKFDKTTASQDTGRTSIKIDRKGR